jgi:acetoin utilization protein AcuB
MTRTPLTVSPERDLHHTLMLMMEGRVRRLPVEEKGRLVGIITEKDIKERCMGNLTHLKLADMQDLLLQIKVGGVMTLRPVVVSPETSLVEAAKTMGEKGIGGLPVVEEGRLVGLITKSDVLRGLLSMMEADGSPQKERRSSPMFFQG